MMAMVMMARPLLAAAVLTRVPPEPEPPPPFPLAKLDSTGLQCKSDDQLAAALPRLPVPLERLGSYDIDAGEATPVIWYGRLLLVETVHVGDAHTKGERVPLPPGRLAQQNATYLRVREFGVGSSTERRNAIVAKIPSSDGACYGSAAVARGPRNSSVLWVFATPNGPAVRPRSQVLAFWSDDPSLQRWHTSVAIQLPTGWDRPGC
jgi:hypothetical protein